MRFSNTLFTFNYSYLADNKIIKITEQEGQTTQQWINRWCNVIITHAYTIILPRYFKKIICLSYGFLFYFYNCVFLWQIILHCSNI